MNELENMVRRLASIDLEIPVTLMEHQSAFRLRDWPSVSKEGMEQIRQIFPSAGLQEVIVQGGSDIPRAVAPLDFGLSSEEFQNESKMMKFVIKSISALGYDLT